MDKRPKFNRIGLLRRMIWYKTTGEASRNDAMLSIGFQRIGLLLRWIAPIIIKLIELRCAAVVNL